MESQFVNITNETGLHARPASEFTKLATSMKCDVFIDKDGKKVNAKSILGVLSLAIGKGNSIQIITEGEEEKESLSKLVDYVSQLTD